MSENIIPSETVPGTADVTAAGGVQADSQNDVVELHKVINAELGTQYKNDEDAINGLKETKSYVGKVGKFAPVLTALQQKYGSETNVKTAMEQLLNDAQAAQPVAPQPAQPDNNSIPREQYEADRFFDKNPQFEPHRDILTALSKQFNKPLAEAAEIPAFKTLLEKATTGEQIEKSKSVMQSNSRLGAVTDKFTQANEAAKAGNVAQGATLVTDAVIDTFGLGK